MVTPTTTTEDFSRTNGATLPHEYDPKRLSVTYPPNEEPMADPIRLQSYLLALLVPLVNLFGNLRDAIVVSNVFLYYQIGDVTKSVAPDLMVAFDVDRHRLSLGKSYHMWVAGKPPAFVMEIGSDSTASRDLTEKRDIYAQIGVREYWLFDPPDGERYKFILKGLRLVDGEYVEIPMIEGTGSNTRGRSEVLGLDICWENDAIRLYDPVADEYLRNHDEAEAEIRRLRAMLSDQGRANR